ncbi:hypothetical protein K7432_015549 [Basidiobolus ranarum]|uniref:SH3 domain-containing protein n=1 Tax=Basidiobolus ranarum TaxID=34480 RepID=A0ABR2WFY3_9FUNG
MFPCCLRTKYYLRMTDEKSINSRSFITSINVYSSRVISVVEATGDYHGDEKFTDALQFFKGDIIHVIEQNGDSFVGFLQNDMNKNLGSFPTNLCKVYKSWLKEKWVETSQTSDEDSSSISSLTTEDFRFTDIDHVITQEPPKYSMSAPTFVKIII